MRFFRRPGANEGGGASRFSAGRSLTEKKKRRTEKEETRVS
jgi:hypothetical protein